MIIFSSLALLEGFEKVDVVLLRDLHCQICFWCRRCHRSHKGSRKGVHPLPPHPPVGFISCRHSCAQGFIGALKAGFYRNLKLFIVLQPAHCVTDKKPVTLSQNIMHCNIPESLPAQVFFLIVCLRPGILFCFSP